MLLQKRAMGKYHFPGLWSNACCTHPRPGELTAEAARRRLWEELGIHCPLQHRYVFEYAAACEGGLVENEIDHVFTGQYEGRIRLNPEEVADTRWVTVESLQDEVAMFPGRFTPWMRMALPQVLMVMESGLVKVPSGPTSVRSSTRKDRLESV
jgi:isopentenyl-diphosphate delta-isomerase